MLPVETPFKTYTGLDGKPLNNGYVYFGQPNQDPIAHPVTVYWDAAGTIPAAQPLRTVNGYIMSAGAPANVFHDGAYSELVKDSKGRQVFYSRTSDEFSIATLVSNFISGLVASAGSSLVGFLPDGAGNAKMTVQDALNETVSVKRFGAKGDGSDDSVAVQAAWNHLKANGGGKLVFPSTSGEKYRFYLDISGINPNIILDFQGSRALPVSGAAHSAVIWADNQALGFAGTNVKILDMNLDGRANGASGNGDVDYGIYLNWACIEIIGGSIQYARKYGVYGSYAQYTKLTDTVLGCCVTNADSWGAYFTGPDSAHRSNEIHATRCVWQSNSNGLYIGGGEKCRLLSPRYQGNVTKGLQISLDAAGNGARSTTVSDPYFEINGGPDITVGPCDSTIIDRAIWNTSGTVAINATHCYNLVVRDSWGNTASAILNHPADNTDTASVLWVGNNFMPTLSLAHNGPTFTDVLSVSGGTVTRDNQQVTSFQSDQGAPTFAIPDWFGTKAAVPKAVATPLFKLTQAAWSTLQYRVAVLTVDLFTWDDATPPTQFGYSGHSQRFTVLITNNTTGSPQVSITPESNGTDVGLSTAYQAPGPVSLTASAAGNDLTFSALWAGSGTGVGGMTQQCIGYLLRGVGTNALTMTRL